MGFVGVAVQATRLLNDILPAIYLPIVPNGFFEHIFQTRHAHTAGRINCDPYDFTAQHQRERW